MKKPTTLKITKSTMLLLIVLAIQFCFLSCEPDKDKYDPDREEVKQAKTL